MSTGSIHHRAKHRIRIRRLALPAVVVFGLTLAAQWSNPFDSVLWSPAHAEGPSPTPKKVVPRDFTELEKRTAAAQRMMDTARKAAAHGDIETVRRQANQAATIPVEWNLGEPSPKKILENLSSDSSDPQRFSDPVTESLNAPIAEGPSPTPKKVVPRVVDFTELAKQKAEARRLMDAARKAVAHGDIETARRQADRAATIPVEWNLGESSPKKFLENLPSDSSDPQRFSDSVTESLKAPILELPQKPLRQRRAIAVETPTPTAVADRDVIELAFPNDRPGDAETAENDLDSMAELPALKFKHEVPSRSANSDMSKTLRTFGFKTSEPVSNSAASVPEPAAAAPRTKPRFAPIPSLEELAESAVVSDSLANQAVERTAQAFKKPASTTAKRSGSPETIEPQKPTAARGRVSVTGASPRSVSRNEEIEVGSDPLKLPTFRQMANDDVVIPTGPIEDSDSGMSSLKNGAVMTSRGLQNRESSDRRPMTSATEVIVPPMPTLATATTVVREIRIAKRPAPVDQAANVNSDRRPMTSATEVIVPPVPTPATATTVVHGIRFAERPAPVDQAANVNSGSASQFLMNLNSLTTALLFGALLLLLVMASVLLLKFSTNSDFQLKFEVSHRNGMAALEHIAKAAVLEPIAKAAVLEPIAKAAVPPVPVTPVYALKRQMEEDHEHQQEDAMMRQVFEDNLKLREQLEDTRFAA